MVPADTSCAQESNIAIEKPGELTISEAHMNFADKLHKPEFLVVHSLVW